MTFTDGARFKQACDLLAAGYGKTLTPQQRDAWWTYLEKYPIDVVEQAFRQAPSHKDAIGFLPSVGVLDTLCRGFMASQPKASGDHYKETAARRPDGVIVARWRCVACEDTGWVGVRTSDGQVLFHGELMEWDRHRTPGPREDGRPHYRMRRCDCRVARTEVA